ncbi:MAG: gamma-glutamyl-gamma-aminobutyrate hydrolase family protein, partial [Ruminococcus sp.]|nr:gamma-glutamyl-gamma-aminobutyrate hydrolase family protein [Ruminococcus sp.]
MRQNGHEYVLIIDFGGQYNQLIARRVRECNVYCEVRSYKSLTLDEIKELHPEGIIFTGGPQSVYGEGAPSIDREVFELGIPVLGICYGSQLMAHVLGGKVQTCTTSEYGKTETLYDTDCVLFGETGDKAVSWMSHT